MILYLWVNDIVMRLEKKFGGIKRNQKLVAIYFQMKDMGEVCSILEVRIIRSCLNKLLGLS